MATARNLATRAAIGGTPAGRRRAAAPTAADPATAAAPAKPAPQPSRTSPSRRTGDPRKTISLALQGGGAHGAVVWGVIDRLLQDERIDIEGISATSAGAMNAAVCAWGLMRGRDAARAALHDFWSAISLAGERYSPLQQTPWERFFHGWNIERSMAHQMFRLVAQTLSPYQINPANFNPLAGVLESVVDFEALRRQGGTRLFLTATNVRSGKARVFERSEVSAQVCLASACVPYLFQAVEIDGEHYWDGGFMGNPPLHPLLDGSASRDVVIVHINPIERQSLPTDLGEIFNRINEISFNTSLAGELRGLAGVQRMLDAGWIRQEFRDRMPRVRLHPLRADRAVSDLSVATKFAWQWDFLTLLRDRGRACAEKWLAESFEQLGVRSSVDGPPGSSASHSA